MDQKPNNPASLRNPFAALSNVFRHLAETETDPILKRQRRRESRKLKELALRESPPKR